MFVVPFQDLFTLVPISTLGFDTPRNRYCNDYTRNQTQKEEKSNRCSHSCMMYGVSSEEALVNLHLHQYCCLGYFMCRQHRKSQSQQLERLYDWIVVEKRCLREANNVAIHRTEWLSPILSRKCHKILQNWTGANFS